MGQLLTNSGAQTASEVVRTLGAVQAQEYADAKWALALRTRGLRGDDVEGELNEGHILRTHVLRPTWHFVTAQDIRWLLALSGPRVIALSARRYGDLQLGDAVLRKSEKVLEKALAGGKHLTRRDITQALTRAGIQNDLPNRHGHILMHAELRGLICSGARRDKQSTYALLDKRVPAAPEIDRDEALSRLAQRYFATRGPATPQDFSWWSGLPMSDVRRAIQVAEKALEEVSIVGRQYWLRPGQGGATVQPSAHLLPIYDEYFVAYKERSAVTMRLSKSGQQSTIGIAPFVLLDGQIVGRWKRRQEKADVVIELEQLLSISASEQRRVDNAIQRYREFLGGTVAA